jgi:hypothetical protein
VPLHVLHFAVEAGLEPAQQVLLVLGDFDTGDAELAEAECLRTSIDCGSVITSSPLSV